MAQNVKTVLGVPIANVKTFCGVPIANCKTIMGVDNTGSASPLLTNLVAYWKMDEASGTRADSVGSNDLTDNNTVTSATGKVGDAADFETGNNESLSIADNADISLGADTDFTLALWYKPETGDTTYPLMVKAGAVSGFDDYAYRLQSDAGGSGKATFRVGNNTSSQIVTSNTGVFSAGTWYFIVAWHDSAADKIYIQVNNDTPAEAAWSDGTFDDGGALYIGAFEGGGTPTVDGLIDEVGFWKRVLTSDERTQLYNSGNGITYPFS